MSDKDQFTFEDDDDFPETDLSSAFSDGEKEADNPTPEFEETFFTDEEEPEPDTEHEPEPSVAVAAAAAATVPEKGKQAKKEKKPKKPKKEKVAGSGGSSRTRGLLLVLLLVIGGAAGAYYFMDLGGTTPAVPTVPVPAKKAVALPPQPAPAPAPAAQPEPAKPVTVAVPPPPPPPAKAAEDQVAKPAEQAAPAQQKVKAEAPKPAPAPAAQSKPEPVKAAETAKAAEPAKAEVMEAEKPAPEVAQAESPAAKPVTAPKQVAGGAFALDAGSYLFESNRDALIAKIKALGYEPKVTPVDATLDMTRLRLGTFSKTEVQEALDMARAIEPGSYSSPAGNQYVIYAGTFLGKGNIDKLTKRFNDEGIKVYPEPVQVVRTLSRIRFGSFATKEDASQAAVAVVGDGIKAVVVKSK